MSSSVPFHRDVNHRRLSTETKASYKTTELIAYAAAVVGVLLASLLVKNHRPPRRLLPRRPGLALHHLADHRVHAQPRARQVRQPPVLRRGDQS